MSELKEIKLDYLNEKEIIEFYELFFGNILIKKPNFPYYSNLSKCLQKDTVVKSILGKLNSCELEILKTVSKNVYVPYQFLVEKLNILLDISPSIVKKGLTNLIERKYIFIRDDKKLVIPDVYFENYKDNIEYVEEPTENREYSSQGIIDINNLLCYYISKEIKHSNSFSLYKREYLDVENIFNTYSVLKEDEFDVVTYLYAIDFIDDSSSLVINRVKNFFSKNSLEKAFHFLKIVFPACYTIFSYFYKQGISVRLKIEDFKELWTKSFLLTEYRTEPIKVNFEKTLEILEKMNLVKIYGKDIVINFFDSAGKENINDTNARLSSSFNFFINADSSIKNFYFPSLFCDFQKYNKIVEYEITEESINRGVKHGLLLSDVMNFFTSLNIKVPSNVESTLRQWFDKHASFFYSSGIHFFCQSKEKGKIISSLIEKGLIKALQIKEDEVFLIPEEEKKHFFNFIEKSGIYYYEKKPVKTLPEIELKTFNIDFILKKREVTKDQ